jgi:hypothetical protein
MKSSILAQVIENQCILRNSADTLGKIKKFIELPLNESRWYVMCSKRSLKLVPGDDVISRLHSLKLVPPKTSNASELLGCKEHLVLL